MVFISSSSPVRVLAVVSASLSLLVLIMRILKRCRTTEEDQPSTMTSPPARAIVSVQPGTSQSTQPIFILPYSTPSSRFLNSPQPTPTRPYSGQGIAYPPPVVVNIDEARAPSYPLMPTSSSASPLTSSPVTYPLMVATSPLPAPSYLSITQTQPSSYPPMTQPQATLIDGSSPPAYTAPAAP